MRFVQKNVSHNELPCKRTDQNIDQILTIMKIGSWIKQGPLDKAVVQ